MTVVRSTVRIAAGSFNFLAAVAECRAGKRAVGGGVGASGGGDLADRVIFSAPTDSSGSLDDTRTGAVPTRWYARYFNGSRFDRDVYVFAICG